MLHATVPHVPFGASIFVIVPSGARTNPWFPSLPSKYQPVIAPKALMLSGSVCIEPGGSNVMILALLG
jgi:hypothetical protein